MLANNRNFKHFINFKQMSNKKHIIIIALVLGFSAFTFAQKMEDLTFIKAGGKIINYQNPKTPNAYVSSPTIYDFDKDGLQDLIVGTYECAFRFYKNTGTKNAPVYNNFTFIQANDENIKIPNPW
jgi:hypothetical protein